MLSTKKWLTYETLREKILDNSFKELHFLELDRLSDEAFVVGIFERTE